MKIEKINESQIKFILSSADLTDRGIKIAEFVFGAEKMQALFREVLEQAMTECNFNVDNCPLMIEVVPLALDSIMITVTKMSHIPDLESKLSNLLPDFTDFARKFKDNQLITAEVTRNSNVLLYSFSSLDDIANLSLRIVERFSGLSSLFKEDGKYYLYLELDDSCNDSMGLDINCILNEYGQRHMASKLSKYYLCEHMDVLIDNNAIDALAKYL